MANYDEYLASTHWQQLRTRIVKAHPFCTCCDTAARLEVHHTSYEHLGAEPDHELMVLCRTCHGELHRRLAIRFPQKPVGWQAQRTWIVLTDMYPAGKRPPTRVIYHGDNTFWQQRRRGRGRYKVPPIKPTTNPHQARTSGPNKKQRNKIHAEWERLRKMTEKARHRKPDKPPAKPVVPNTPQPLAAFVKRRMCA